MNVLVDYLASGFALIPIPSGSKGPTTIGWNREENAVVTESALGRVLGNVGLAHAWCAPTPTCAVDFDDFVAAEMLLAKNGIDATALLTANDAVQVKSGRPNRAKLLYRLPAVMASRKFTGANGSVVLELRCADRAGNTLQDVLPPSIHPETGRPYVWGGAGTYRELPMIPPPLLAFWTGSLVPHATSASTCDGAAVESYSADAALIEDLRSALWAVPSDDYDDWVRIGCALKTLTPEDAARALWMEWSTTSAKFCAADAARKWASFSPTATSYRAVFAEAQRRGWVNPAAVRLPRHDPDAVRADADANDAVEFDTEGSPSPFREVSLANLHMAEHSPSEHVLEPYLPLAVPSLLGGDGGTGKSYLGVTLAAHGACGRAWAGYPMARVRALYVSLEDDGQLVLWRLRRIAKAYDLPLADVVERVRVLVVAAGDDPTLAVEMSRQGVRELVLTRAFRALAAAVDGEQLIVVDNASDAFAGDEINRRQVRAFMRALGDLARQHNASVLLLAHVDKQSAKHGGAGRATRTAGAQRGAPQHGREWH